MTRRRSAVRRSRRSPVPVLLAAAFAVVVPEGRAQEYHFPPETKLGYFADIGGPRAARERELFRPASVSKIITALAAIRGLGPDFRFRTRVEWRLAAGDATRAAHVRFVGDGDPTFGVADYGDVAPARRFRALAEAMRARGIARVSGPPVFVAAAPDLNRRERRELPHGWLTDDYRYCFGLGAVPSAFNYRENCGVYTITDRKTGRWDVAALDRPVRSDLTYGTRNAITIAWDPVARENRLVGTYRAGTRPAVTLPMRYEDTLRIFEREFIAALAAVGIAYVPAAPDADIPIDGAADSYEIESPALPVILKPYLKESLNYVGEALVLALGARAPVALGATTYDRGVATVRATLDGFRGNDGEIVHDGCGLSRESRLSPRSIHDLLVAIARDAELLPLFLDLLPISGVDGTLENRFAESRLAGRVRAKTGSLDGVATLAGFFRVVRGTVTTWSPFVIFDQSRTVLVPRPEVDRLFRGWVGIPSSAPNALRPAELAAWIREREEPLRIEGDRPPGARMRPLD